MKQLIPLTDDGLFVDAKTERIFCDSRFVARAFEKAAVFYPIRTTAAISPIGVTEPR